MYLDSSGCISEASSRSINFSARSSGSTN
jgi:hypothetical protein